MRKRDWRGEGAAWGVVCLFVIVMGALTFAPLRTADSPVGIALPYDTGDYYSPLTFFSDYWIKHGDFPEWNGFYLCGMPFAANPQALLFYPPNILRRLTVDGLHPKQTVYSMLAMVAVHIVIAGLGAFALARSHGLGRMAALVTTVAFVFSAGFVIRSTMHWVFPTTLAWIPWMWLALRRVAFAHSLKSACYWAVAAGVFTGLCLLAGFPQLAYFAMLSGGIYFLVLATRPLLKHAEAIAGRYLLAILLIGAVSFSTAAMLLLPGLELMQHSSRAIGSAVEIQSPAAREVVEPTALLSQLILYSGTKNTEDPRLCGVGIWLFALLSPFWKKRRDVAACGLTFAFLLLCAVNSDGIFGRLINATTPFE